MRSGSTRRGFTLLEVMIAGVMTAFLLGSISMTLAQLSRAKGTCKERLDAHLRANAALTMIRQDVASIIRSDDLFYTRFDLTDSTVNTPIGELERDELMMFITKLRPIRDIEFNGEGSEYETQYRIQEQDGGTMLWQRRDAFPDKYPTAGGIITPGIENVVGLMIEAYDGEQWFDDWDSDVEGLPYAVRVTVTATGARPDQDLFDAAVATLRTVVAIDRVPPPTDALRLTDEELEELDARVLFEIPVAADVPQDGGTSGRGRGAGGSRPGGGGDGFNPGDRRRPTGGRGNRGGGGQRGGSLGGNNNDPVPPPPP